MWPPVPGTQRWLNHFGAQTLLCVRHREDPAGLRRVVTVELVVAEVGARAGQRRLVAHRLYPVRIDARALAQRLTMKAAGGRWDAEQGLWYLSGAAVLTLGLIDRVAIDRQPKRQDRKRT